MAKIKTTRLVNSGACFYPIRRKPDGAVMSVSKHFLACFTDVPIRDAAVALGLCLTTLKTVRRWMGVGRWPHRWMHKRATKRPRRSNKPLDLKASGDGGVLLRGVRECRATWLCDTWLTHPALYCMLLRVKAMAEANERAEDWGPAIAAIDARERPDIDDTLLDHSLYEHIMQLDAAPDDWFDETEMGSPTYAAALCEL